MGKHMICHECGARMSRDTKAVEYTYKDKSTTLDQPAWYCTKCDESVLTPEDAGATESAFVAFKAGVDGVLTPDEVRLARQALGLSQRKAGVILGGGARAFYKYEHGHGMVSRPMSNLLRLLWKNPELLALIDDAAA